MAKRKPTKPSGPPDEGRGPSAVTRIDTAGGAAVGGDVDTNGGNFAGRDTWIVNIQVASEQAAERFLRGLRAGADLEAATRRYLEYLLTRHRYLEFRGMGVDDKVPLKMPLLDLYVPLKARQEMPDGETWERHLRLAGRAVAEDEQIAAARRLGEPVPALDLLRKSDGLIVLGDPGSGKSTFLKFLALALAAGQGAGLGLADRLPVLVPLSAYAAALAGGNLRLDDFIAEYFRNSVGDLPLGRLMERALAEKRALVLLDGLDEVADAGLRRTTVDRVVDFYCLHRQGNKFVLTSRIVGYREVRPAADGLAECTLVDFEDEEIGEFVGRWTAALEHQALGATDVAAADADRERRELLEAVATNPGVRRLAANPLLLTILALMKRQGVTLPDRRVQLYHKYVDVFLSSWNRARGLAGRPVGRDRDAVATIKILAPLALWMHEESPGLGLVPKERLRRRIEALYAERGEPDAESLARDFLRDLGADAGLLMERGPGQFGFIHLTFEEFLAAVAIAQRGQQGVQAVVEYLAARVGNGEWQEVGCLALGYLGIIQQRDEAAGAVAEGLAGCNCGAPGAAAVWAGEALADVLPDGVPPVSRKRVVESLVATMQSGEVAAPLRRRAGLLLGGRFGWRPDDLDEFVEIPAGDFLFGENCENVSIPYRYWIGKYPVTNCQYARFVDDGGYRRHEFWSEAGSQRQQREGREDPRYWKNADFGNPIFPVVGIGWQEAQAYCNWLNALGPEAGVPQEAGYRVRLPIEQEWERAARGTDGRKYPWEGGFEPALANTAEGKPDRTAAVCTYPDGRSATGLWDMAGNVWEWTSSPWSQQDPAPVLRGGSWLRTAGYARCAYRNGLVPDNFFDVIGFRVVVSVPVSDS
jgi:formylglycine-generating enzyme required for sulfatase activity